MQQKLLTIVVPTYNRAACLSLLLDALGREIDGMEDHVDVIVGDNASSDRTPEVTATFRMASSAARILRHPQNVGAEENFCRCLEQVTSRFFWIIGDDDLPRTGTVVRLVNMLRSLDPDLLHMGSEWLPEIQGPDTEGPVSELKPVRLSSEAFAAHVNVWVTFISSMVINHQRLRELYPGADLRRFKGTSLVQLGWVLPLLMSGQRLFVIRERCVLATAGNSGGYQLVSVFATHLPAIVDAVCGPASPQRRGIMHTLMWNYLPDLLWITRIGDATRFSNEDVRESLRPLRGTLAHRLLLGPILDLPKPLAFTLWAGSRLYGKVWRLLRAGQLRLREHAGRNRFSQGLVSG